MQRLTPDNPKVVWESEVRWMLEVDEWEVLKFDTGGIYALMTGDPRLHGSRIRITAEVIGPEKEQQ